MKVRRLVATMVFGVAVAVAPNVAGELKVAVVNTVQAIQLSEEAKTYMENIQQEFEPEQNDLRALQDEIRALQKKITDDGEVMSNSERRGVEKDIENKSIDLDFRAQKLNKNLQDRREELIRTVGPKVQSIVQDLVEVERYDLVFERSTIGYVNPRHDITAKVTEKLNERYAEEN